MMIFWRRQRKHSSISSDSGQASLEMVLLLVIGMLVALGTIYRFNTAFKKYTTDMYGTYYRCLLETGELPGVASVCGDRKARFEIANGRELVRNVPGSAGTGGDSGSGGGGGGSGGSGSGGGQNSGSSGNQASGGSSGSNGGRGSESVGGSSRASGGGSGSVVGRLRNLGRQRSTAVGQAGDDGSAGDSASMSDSTTGGNYGSRATTNQLRRPQTKMNFKMDDSSVEREEKAKVTSVTASKTGAKAGERGDSLRPRKTVENTDRKPAANLDEGKGGGLEFGRLFRIFLIIVIIVAIAVFLGGQVLQISKSSEQ